LNCPPRFPLPSFSAPSASSVFPDSNDDQTFPPFGSQSYLHQMAFPHRCSHEDSIPPALPPDPAAHSNTSVAPVSTIPCPISRFGRHPPEDLARMEKGKPPIGPDGHPMELHHVDRTQNGPLEPMSRTDHRLGENMKKNHPPH